MEARLRLTASLAALTVACTVHAQTRYVYVDASAPAGGTGVDWNRAFRDLQAAFDSLSTGPAFTEARFYVAQGIYVPTHAFSPLSATTLAGFGIRFCEATGTCAAPSIRPPTSLSISGSYAGRRSSDPDVQDFVRTPTILSGDLLGDDTPDGTHRADNVGPLLTLAGRVPRSDIYGIQFIGGRGLSLRRWPAGWRPVRSRQ